MSDVDSQYDGSSECEWDESGEMYEVWFTDEGTENRPCNTKMLDTALETENICICEETCNEDCDYCRYIDEIIQNDSSEDDDDECISSSDDESGCTSDCECE